MYHDDLRLTVGHWTELSHSVTVQSLNDWTVIQCPNPSHPPIILPGHRCAMQRWWPACRWRGSGRGARSSGQWRTWKTPGSPPGPGYTQRHIITIVTALISHRSLAETVRLTDRNSVGLKMWTQKGCANHLFILLLALLLTITSHFVWLSISPWCVNEWNILNNK